MAKQDINYGSEVGDPTAESVFDSFKKSKENFDELYDDLSTAEGEIDALQSDVDDLKVSTIYVDEGITLKRISPRAKGRADRISKRTCHITIKVGV